jgi:hypothetical protein
MATSFIVGNDQGNDLFEDESSGWFLRFDVKSIQKRKFGEECSEVGVPFHYLPGKWSADSQKAHVRTRNTTDDVGFRQRMDDVPVHVMDRPGGQSVFTLVRVGKPLGPRKYPWTGRAWPRR